MTQPIKIFLYGPLLFFAFIFVQSCDTAVHSNMVAKNLTCEYQKSAIGIDVVSPRLSWIVEAPARNRIQSAFQILVASTSEKLSRNEGDLWDSQIIKSSECLNIKYAGKQLKSRQKCYWKVRVWDEAGVISDWSETGFWSIGLLNENDWNAKWIGLDEAISDTNFKTKPRGNGVKRKRPYRPLPCPIMRKEFEIDEDTESAIIYASALGVYELYVNGERVNDSYFAPGWTDYSCRVVYDVYNVGPLLKKGVNTISAVLADGWYAGNIGTYGQGFYGKRLRFIAQLEVTSSNGNTQSVVSDSTWKAAYGPILESDFQSGETYDSRLEIKGWKESKFDDERWFPVVVSDSVISRMVGRGRPKITVKDSVVPMSIKRLGNKHIIDMGHNFSGWARVTANGSAGDSIVLRFAEQINADGSIHTRNLRGARCTDIYVMTGDTIEIWEPHFTYRGYRYIEVNGYPGELTRDKILGIRVQSDLEETGEFTCSNKYINQINANILRSQQSNFISIPTDNPQRDERLGWTADAQLFMKTAAYNMNVASFLSEWLQDFKYSPSHDGAYTWTSPKIYNGCAAGWGDAGVVVPWQLFLTYNDTGILEARYSSMNKWLSFLQDTSDANLSNLETFGDWQNVKSETPKRIMSTAYYKHSVDITTKIAEVLGHSEDAARLKVLSNKIMKAFTNEFVDHDGFIEGNTQTSYLMALAFELIPDSLRHLVSRNLVTTIVENDTCLTTGIHGTALLLSTLEEIGELDLAYHLLTSRKYPSWGYQIDQGATTIWERWDSYSLESGMHEDSTNSLNQYAFGSIGSWFYSSIAGIKSDGPGYKNIVIDPKIGGGLTQARASYKSIRGTIKSEWEVDDNNIQLLVTIPANTMATVYIPATNVLAVSESGIEIHDADGVLSVEKIDDEVRIKVGSGTYSFQSTLPD